MAHFLNTNHCFFKLDKVAALYKRYIFLPQQEKRKDGFKWEWVGFA